jgi:carboxyl-terminal processing protease
MYVGNAPDGKTVAEGTFALSPTDEDTAGESAADKAAAGKDSTLDEMRSIIKADYPLEIPPGVMEALSVPDMLQALDDPYARYMSVSEFSELMDVINMSFVGIGVSLEVHREGMLISKVFQGSPAAEAGLRPGGSIVRVGGVALSGLGIAASVAFIKGEPGSRVEVDYYRGDETMTSYIERRAVSLPQVTGEVSGTVGCIMLSSFGAGVDKEFGETVEALRRQGAQSWIIDLRGNGGGLVDSALEMLGFFIEDRDAVLWQTAKEMNMEKAIRQELTIDEPLIILANGMTASASEIFIGALKDYGKASVLGGQTFGSGRFKQIYPLSNGDYFMMSITLFYTPKNETPVDAVGLPPDVQISDKEAESAAMLLLKTEGDNAQGRDETGYLKWNVGAQSFRVSLADWRKEENWHAGQELIDQCFGNTMVSVGSAQGWLPMSEEDVAEGWRVYFPGYQLLGFQYIPQTGSSLVQTSLIEGLRQRTGQAELVAELIDETNGQRIQARCSFNDQGLEVSPQENLKPDRTYWLVFVNGDDSQGSIAVLNTHGLIEIQ